MKRIGYLYDKMCDVDLIKEAIHNAAKEKMHYAHVRKIVTNDDKYAQKIKYILEEESFEPSPYINDVIKEGPNRKQRDISKPRFYPDQVIHWCIYLALKPWLFNRFYGLNCGSIPGKGVHYGKRHAAKWIRSDRKNTKYYLKLDVRKFYQSIQPRRIIEKLKRIIKDERFIRINAKILSMSDGLPIGMLLSQVYANFFLTDIDYWIKQELKAKYYIRYMDDMVIFGNNKKSLHKMREEIDRRLNENGLQLKSNWQVCRLDKEPLDFMGFRFYRKHTALRKCIMFSITRKVRKAYRAGANVSAGSAAAVISYLGWITHSDSYGMFCKWIKPYLCISRLKDAVRRKQKYENIRKLVGGETGRMGQDIQQKQNIPQHRCYPGGRRRNNNLQVYSNRVYEQRVCYPEPDPG